jgi:hypothetical protein
MIIAKVKPMAKAKTPKGSHDYCKGETQGESKNPEGVS